MPKLTKILIVIVLILAFLNGIKMGSEIFVQRLFINLERQIEREMDRQLRQKIREALYEALIKEIEEMEVDDNG